MSFEISVNISVAPAPAAFTSLSCAKTLKCSSYLKSMQESVGFLVAIKEALESPEELLMDNDVKKALEL
ncbi:hypothetical protein ACFSQ0_10025 [Mesonia sediminis]|uniref:Uncharacterized protein n=1 Tax=Mesonia sediminis TaxID=1703946 RepID=A0ABW5SI84_9FLAO